MHSVFSDGTNTPAELVAMAEKRSLKAIALTDHDTVGGIPHLLAAAENASVEAIPGIELSADCERGTMHILGYLFDHTCETLLAQIDKIQKGREERNLEILKKLNKLGYTLLWSDVEKHIGSGVVGRPHFAAALVERGHVKSRKAAFELLLAKGRPGYADRFRLTAKECIELIRQAGGVSVLAHPATIYLPDDKLKALVGKLKNLGLNGIEVYYAENRPENRKKFMGWAEQFDLICTGGTDFHGNNTPDIKVGTGFGQLCVPDEVLDNLKAKEAKPSG
jgi:predicted metal-dependent phosphoesterase TrpH